MEVDYEQIATVIASVIAVATAVTAITPSKSDDAILNGILKVLNLLAGNVLKNKNADDVKEEDPHEEAYNEK
jgi:hypothetical protein